MSNNNEGTSVDYNPLLRFWITLAGPGLALLAGGGGSAAVSDVLVQVRDLKKHFPVKEGVLSRTVSPTAAR